MNVHIVIMIIIIIIIIKKKKKKKKNNNNNNNNKKKENEWEKAMWEKIKKKAIKKNNNNNNKTLRKACWHSNTISYLSLKCTHTQNSLYSDISLKKELKKTDFSQNVFGKERDNYLSII